LTIVLPLSLIAQTNPADQTLVITHVTVIDMTGTAPKPDMTVVIRGARIAAMGRAGEVSMPQNARTIDATGKFLIPGLWDMHTHTYYKTRDAERSYFPLLVANGVTGVREMHNVYSIKQFNRWRDEIAKGKLMAPRLAAVGRKVDGLTGISIKVRNEMEARDAVKQIKREGYDFVKVYSFLSREAFFALADEAKRQGIPFAGHVPFSVSAAEASNAGQRSMEHLGEMITSSSTEEALLRKETLDFLKKVENLKGKPLTPDLLKEDSLLTDRNLRSFSREMTIALSALFVKNDTYHCPTLIILRHNLSLDEPQFADDPRLRYVPLSIRQSFQQEVALMVRTTPAAQLAERFADNRRIYARRLEILKIMHQAGVRLLAGADASAPAAHYAVPGFSLHDELELFVGMGLSPMEALQSATYNPAKYLGLLDALGTVEQGKLADLVLLDANPLEKITNTKRINAVILNGRYLTKEALQKMLADVEDAARER
jgi:imidazolonepropionase-like amidohydrolase